MSLFSRSVLSDSATPWTAACQASLSCTIFRSFLRLMPFEYHGGLFSSEVLCRKSVCAVTRSRPALCDPTACSPPGSASMGDPRQEHWSGRPFPSLRDLFNPGIKPESLALADGFLESPWKDNSHLFFSQLLCSEGKWQEGLTWPGCSRRRWRTHSATQLEAWSHDTPLGPSICHLPCEALSPPGIQGLPHTGSCRSYQLPRMTAIPSQVLQSRAKNVGFF